MSESPEKRSSGTSEFVLAVIAALLAVPAFYVAVDADDAVNGGVQVVVAIVGVLLAVVAVMAVLTAYAKGWSR